MAHAMMHAMSETRALSYREIAKLFAITVPSARNMVRRRMWHRVPSNDPKTVRVLVPVEELPVGKTTGDAPRDVSSDGSSENAMHTSHLRDGARDESLGASLAILTKHIETLQAELEPLRATATQVAALNAALNAARDDTQRLRDERDRLLTQIMTRQPWWRRLVG